MSLYSKSDLYLIAKESGFIRDNLEKEEAFVEEFNNQKYLPELLFDDKAIIERIRKHPMALWKTRKRLR